MKLPRASLESVRRDRTAREGDVYEVPMTRIDEVADVPAEAFIGCDAGVRSPRARPSAGGGTGPEASKSQRYATLGARRNFDFELSTWLHKYDGVS